MLMQKVLVLAGGYDQIELIRELKKRGYSVLLADYLDNPPAKEAADIFYQVSTLDEEKICEIARKEKVDLIITACTDQALLTVASVSEKLGLPFYLSREQTRNVTNKFYMKQKFKQNRISSADYEIFESRIDKDDISRFKKFPYIVKPCDCNSSKGVRKVDNEQDLLVALQDAIQLSRTHKAVMEKYLEGMEISIDAWICDGVPEILSITETRKMNHDIGRFTIYQSRYPVEISDEIYKQIEKNTDLICSGFGLKEGPLLVQAIIEKNEVYILEFSARMGGGSKYKLIEYISGINIMEKYVDFVITGKNTKAVPQRSDRQIEVDYIYANNGVVKEITGVEQLKQNGTISEAFMYKKNGSEITQRVVSGDRVLGVLLEADTIEELENKRTAMLQDCRIIDETGADILYRECFAE